MKVMEFLTQQKWCKRGLARNKDGQGVAVKSPEAVTFCLVGAVMFCYPEEQNVVMMKLGNVCKKLFGYPALVTFNNEATWDQVVAVLKEAKL